jgi:predicted O-methyltransferase YrrM
MSLTLKINYNNNISDLCLIGKKYDTDKSSQRNNVSDIRHCHPYTLFYNELFKNKKNEILNIAELGILNGGSLLMWQEYFQNSKIFGFEYNNDLINNFKKNCNNDRITLSTIDVTNKSSIENAFKQVNVLYDIIIDDTTHQYDDQIRIIENTYSYLKEGGILIIENVFKSYNEKEFIEKLQPILKYFQDYFFVELDHTNKNSTGWDNDKLFILIKGGSSPIFKNENKLTIITPSYRINNLFKLKESIDFNYVEEWIIVYDGSKIKENPNLFLNDCNNIKEYVHVSEGISGNPQRNFALESVTNKNTLLYFLDDDNIIHNDIYKLLNFIDNNKFYTFNQNNSSAKDKILIGNEIKEGFIDTAMYIVPYKFCKEIKWVVNLYAADFYFIYKIYETFKDKHVYVNNTLCYYNNL